MATALALSTRGAPRLPVGGVHQPEVVGRQDVHGALALFTVEFGQFLVALSCRRCSEGLGSSFGAGLLGLAELVELEDRLLELHECIVVHRLHTRGDMSALCAEDDRALVPAEVVVPVLHVAEFVHDR